MVCNNDKGARYPVNAFLSNSFQRRYTANALKGYTRNVSLPFSYLTLPYKNFKWFEFNTPSFCFRVGVEASWDDPVRQIPIREFQYRAGKMRTRDLPF